MSAVEPAPRLHDLQALLRLPIAFQAAGKRAIFSKIGITLTYVWRHRRPPSLFEPLRFTEWVQHRKIHGRDRRMSILADKMIAKEFVTGMLGAEWVVPTLWSGTQLPAQPQWPAPFVVKSRHGCNQIAFVRSGQEDWSKIRARARRWMKTTYGFWLSEWTYRHIEKGVLVEAFIGDATKLPVDYKFYVFGGRVEFIQVHLEREHAHRWILFDRNWQRVSARTADADPVQPKSIGAMIHAAEKLGAAFDFVRVDLYEVGGAPLFGEMTFYPGSGLDPFDPDGLDITLGAYWRRAIDRRTSTNMPARAKV
jgi:hypothetical protein